VSSLEKMRFCGSNFLFIYFSLTTKAEKNRNAKNEKKNPRIKFNRLTRKCDFGGKMKKSQMKNKKRKVRRHITHFCAKL
jgi:hypothetical protein